MQDSQYVPMSISQRARMTIVIYSLAITAGLIVFLILAQPLGMRFDYSQEQNLRLIDVVLPTFFAYLGAASHFLFNSSGGRDIHPKHASMLMVLIHGPFITFILAVASLFLAHYLTHRPLPNDAPRIDPLTYDALSRYLSVCLALLAATVSVVSAYLFGAPPVGEAALPAPLVVPTPASSVTASTAVLASGGQGNATAGDSAQKPLE